MIFFMILVVCFVAGAYPLSPWIVWVLAIYAIGSNLYICLTMERYGLAVENRPLPVGMWAAAVLIPGVMVAGAYYAGWFYGAWRFG